MASQNDTTPFVRQCVALWIAQAGNLEFCVPLIVNELTTSHECLGYIDITKSVSNELIRLETMETLVSRIGSIDDGCGLGRPPRLYTKRFCSIWKINA